METIYFLIPTNYPVFVLAKFRNKLFYQMDQWMLSFILRSCIGNGGTLYACMSIVRCCCTERYKLAFNIVKFASNVLCAVWLTGKLHPKIPAFIILHRDLFLVFLDVTWLFSLFHNEICSSSKQIV